jgi:hypothetical protein
MAFEYRVRWQREGRRPATAIYQGWDAAYRKWQSVMALDRIKPGTSYETLPDLTGPAVIETREVGPWHANPVQPSPLTDTVVENVRNHLEWTGRLTPHDPTPERTYPF